MPAVLTILPAQTKMVNVTVFVDITNIAQYTQKQVSHSSDRLQKGVSLPHAQTSTGSHRCFACGSAVLRASRQGSQLHRPRITYNLSDTQFP